MLLYLSLDCSCLFHINNDDDDDNSNSIYIAQLASGVLGRELVLHNKNIYKKETS